MQFRNDNTNNIKELSENRKLKHTCYHGNYSLIYTDYRKPFLPLQN